MSKTSPPPISPSSIDPTRAIRRRTSPPLFQLAEKAIRERLEVLLRHEAGTRIGRDIESLHDMRVASRRLREALRLYANLYPSKKLRRALKDLQQVTKALGLVREVDVNIAQLESLRSRSGEKFAVPLELALAQERARQRRLRKRMLARLDELDLNELNDAVSKMLEDPLQEHERMNPVADTTQQSFLSFARGHIRDGLSGLLAFRKKVERHSTLLNYHQFRIRLKKFRYCVELLARAFEPHRVARILTHLKTLQDDLGCLHDRSVLHGTLRALRRRVRDDGLSHLEHEMLRLMRWVARERNIQRTAVEKHFARLVRREFFERIPQAIKPEIELRT